MYKILIYIPFIKIGGIEKVAMEYAKILSKDGHEVTLMIDYNMGRHGNKFETLIPEKVKYFYVKHIFISKIIYYFRTLGKKNKFFNIFLYALVVFTDYLYFYFKIKRKLLKERYSNTFTFYQFLPSYLTNIKQSKNFIWLHGSVEHFFDNKIISLFKQRFERKLNKYDLVVSTAYEMEEQLKTFFPNLPKNQIITLYNPIDYDNVLLKAKSTDTLSKKEIELIREKYICTVCRLDEHQKDVTTLIIAFSNFINLTKSNLKLMIVGDGVSRKDLEDLVLKLNLQNIVFFVGNQLNSNVWIDNADIFVLSSKFEGLPTVLIEALSMNTLIVASDCKTGPKEILKNKAGLLFDVGDNKSLTQIFINYSNNKINKIEKIENAHKQQELFSSKTILIKLKSFL
jgi:glycosyltransferase involved in cell wall biosynthesis